MIQKAWIWTDCAEILWRGAVRLVDSNGANKNDCSQCSSTNRESEQNAEGKPFPPSFAIPCENSCSTVWIATINSWTCKNGHSIAAGSSLKVQRLGIEDCAARKQNLTNRYQVDHHNKSVHKDARTQKYKHSTYSISSPSIFKQKIAGFFSTVPKPPLLTPTIDSRQESTKIRSTQMFLCKQHLQTGQQGCYSERWNVFKGQRCHSNPSQEHLTTSLVYLSSFSVLGALFVPSYKGFLCKRSVSTFTQIW